MLALALALTFFAGALLLWDKRTPWQKFLEADSLAPKPFTRALKRDAQVFWLDGVEETWLLLRRPSYFSMAQGAGALFDRQTALTYARRARELVQLDPRDNFKVPTEDGSVPPVVTAATLADTCRSSFDLDAIISGRRAPGVPATTWRAPVSRAVRRREHDTLTYEWEQEFYLYRCSEFR